LVLEARGKVGRFLKKRDPVLKKASVVEFSFEEICRANVVTLDNTDSTIIHSSMHSPEDLRRGVVLPPKFDDTLMENEFRRPIILPMDFTKDWEKQNKRRRDRADKGDDDDYDNEYDYVATPREAAKPKAEEAAQAVAEVAHEAPPAPEKITPQALDTGAKMMQDALHQTREQPPAVEVSPRLEFIPTVPKEGLRNEPDPEAIPSDVYQKRIQEARAEADRIRSEAKDEGYRAGFRLGEEKGNIQGLEHLKQIAGTLQSQLAELRDVKGQILESVQENFYEVAQAIAEALLQREFTISPAAFADFIRATIKENLGEDEHKIHVHPATLERLTAAGITDLPFAANEQIKENNFRVESKISVIDGDIRKLISDMLQNADLTLFDDKEKAS
jgi:flagellar biosynthesis/type III secretory pathway protein FliH